MAALFGMLQREREPRDTPEQTLADELGAAFERYRLSQLRGNDGAIPELLWRVSGHSTGITRLEDGRFAYVCGKHELARLAIVADPADLAGFTCRVCDAEREAVAERRRFMELLHAA